MDNEQQDKILMEIHTTVTTLAAEAREDRRLATEVRTAVFGTGEDGIKLDVDRLKIFKKTACKVGWALGLAVLGLIGRLVYNSIVT